MTFPVRIKPFVIPTASGLDQFLDARRDIVRFRRGDLSLLAVQVLVSVVAVDLVRTDDELFRVDPVY